MKKNNKWLMFLILLISAITVGVSQLKIAAVMQDVAAALGVSTTQAALLMSVFTIAGIVLAPMFGYIGICLSNVLAWIFADAFLLPAFRHCIKK